MVSPFNGTFWSIDQQIGLKFGNLFTIVCSSSTNSLIMCMVCESAWQGCDSVVKGEQYPLELQLYVSSVK
jgi:hypothetical protein